MRNEGAIERFVHIFAGRATLQLEHCAPSLGISVKELTQRLGEAIYSLSGGFETGFEGAMPRVWYSGSDNDNRLPSLEVAGSTRGRRSSSQQRAAESVHSQPQKGTQRVRGTIAEVAERVITVRQVLDDCQPHSAKELRERLGGADQGALGRALKKLELALVREGLRVERKGDSFSSEISYRLCSALQAVAS